MKSFVAALAIVACAGTLLPFGSVNGDSIKILSSYGSYIPGSVNLYREKRELWILILLDQM